MPIQITASGHSGEYGYYMVLLCWNITNERLLEFIVWMFNKPSLICILWPFII